MALAGNVGARLHTTSFEDLVDSEKLRHAWSLFAENQARYVVTEPMHFHVVEKLALEADVGCCFIGWTGGKTIWVGPDESTMIAEVPLADLRAAHESFFTDWMKRLRLANTPRSAGLGMLEGLRVGKRLLMPGN